MPARIAPLARRLQRCTSISSNRSYATVSEQPLRTALFFPGHGVQRKGMTGPWLKAFPKTCKPFLEEMDEILQTKLSTLIEDGPIYMLDKTENAQPAIMAVRLPSRALGEVY
jgi:[acyl-carrier-protein] S-malonyltransferase